MQTSCVRQILPHVKDFKKFWKEKGPFRYALTSNEFPPILLEPEEWLFGNEIMGVLKELMQFGPKKMAFVRAAFNLDNTNYLRPQGLIPWKINHFPEQWNGFPSEIFVPEGHLTSLVLDEARAIRELEMSQNLKEPDEKSALEKGFFSLLEKDLENMGYVLLKPQGNAKFASIKDYLSEWERDEEEAGLI